MLGEGALVASVLGTSGALLYLQYLRNKVNIRRKSCGFIAGYLWSPSLSTVPQEQGKISTDKSCGFRRYLWSPPLSTVPLKQGKYLQKILCHF